VADALRELEPDRDVLVDIAPGVHATGDPALLRIVLENLMGNAWKFTSKHPEAKIEFGSDVVDGEMRYFVRDDGAGFDMAYASKLFGAFQRVHGQTEFPGVGIGLATTARIIRRHGGRIWAEGEPEGGATFWFVLS
jgi:light-regulated signal transduction histidine kinase (bacteriophytochrome)